jgi:ubiquinone/menaquinone biosynthesis C-methylase UbiE
MSVRLPIAAIIVREFLARKRCPRIPEPSLVMNDEQQVAAYTLAGREAGVMAPIYLHHCAHICDVVRPGDTVVDLACGPATQLAMVARLNPGTRFIGIDLSAEMLDRAERHIRELSLTNVELRRGDITALYSLADHSIDAFTSTMALHHLSGQAALERVFLEIARVIRINGGLYLVDFGRLKTLRSIEDFAYQYADRQPEQFTIDYLNSLKAAFSKEEFAAASRPVSNMARLATTLAVPYMVSIKSPARREPDPGLKDGLRAILCALPPHHRKDYRDLKRFFRLGGLKSVHAP